MGHQGRESLDGVGGIAGEGGACGRGRAVMHDREAEELGRRMGIGSLAWGLGFGGWGWGLEGGALDWFVGPGGAGAIESSWNGVC